MSFGRSQPIDTLVIIWTSARSGSIAAFGTPVVPPVYSSQATSSDPWGPGLSGLGPASSANCAMSSPRSARPKVRTVSSAADRASSSPARVA